MIITYRQFVAAMRKSGYPKAQRDFIIYEIRGEESNSFGSSLFFSEHINEVGSACAIGQAALNLRVHPKDISAHLDLDMKIRIYHLNDNEDWDISTIADKIESEFSSLMDKKIDHDFVI